MQRGKQTSFSFNLQMTLNEELSKSGLVGQALCGGRHVWIHADSGSVSAMRLLNVSPGPTSTKSRTP